MKVFDAAGDVLPATMSVTADSTEITIGAGALAMASYPVTIDPEIGTNDFLLSDMGPEGSDAFGAHTPAVGINTSDGSMLTVWSGDDDENGHIDDEFEIFGQLFTGLPEFAITEIVPTGNSVIIRFMSDEGVVYALQESTDLNTWTDAGAGQITGTDGTSEITDPDGNIGAARRYFRVVR